MSLNLIYPADTLTYRAVEKDLRGKEGVVLAKVTLIKD
jgi:hypothetical protein